MMWWGNGNWGAADWLAMSLMMLVFWALIFALIVPLVRNSSGQPTDPSGARRQAIHPPDEVLAERFARGEIDEDEFTRRRALLHATHGGSRPTGGA